MQVLEHSNIYTCDEYGLILYLNKDGNNFSDHLEDVAFVEVVQLDSELIVDIDPVDINYIMVNSVIYSPFINKYKSGHKQLDVTIRNTKNSDLITFSCVRSEIHDYLRREIGYKFTQLKEPLMEDTIQQELKLDDIKVGNIYLSTLYKNERPFIITKKFDNEEIRPVRGIVLGEQFHENFRLEHIKRYRFRDSELDISYSNKSFFISSSANLFDKFTIQCEDSEFSDALTKALAEISDKLDTDIKVTERGRNSKPDCVILDEVEPEQIKLNGTTIIERYVEISGRVTDATAKINQEFTLEDVEDLKSAFLKARAKIEATTHTKPVTATFLRKLGSKVPFASKIAGSVKESLIDSKSAQSNIDYLFGIIEEKYEKLITVGESFQSAKASILSRIEALEELSTESKAYLATFGDRVLQPTRDLATDVQIDGAIESLRARLVKIDGAIMATQNTIFVFGKDLPALKSDLTDETALGNLLGTVDDYQAMGQEVAQLVANITNSTAEKTHEVIENLLEVQINDTHTMEYLEKSSKRALKFGKMVEKKSKVLADKVTRDAEFISTIVSGKNIDYARKHVPKLK